MTPSTQSLRRRFLEANLDAGLIGAYRVASRRQAQNKSEIGRYMHRGKLRGIVVDIFYYKLTFMCD